MYPSFVKIQGFQANFELWYIPHLPNLVISRISSFTRDQKQNIFKMKNFYFLLMEIFVNMQIAFQF